VVGPWLGQVDDHLEREDEVTVEVTVQRVPVARPVLQDQRGRLGLAGLMAHLKPLVQGIRPQRGPPKLGVPVTGDRQQVRIKGVAELINDRGERAGQVAVLALAEAVPAHRDGGAERVIAVVEPDQRGRVGRGKQPGREGAAEFVELGGDRRPVGAVSAPLVDRGSFGAGGGSFGAGGRGHAEASRSRS
jgi:hypothetical protein